MWAFRLVLLALVGCSDGGRVALHLDVPDDPSLDPFTLSISELTLAVTATGEAVLKESRPLPGPGETLDFGRIPFGDAMTFELSGVTEADRVVALGRSAVPVDVTEGDDVDVDLAVRRPFVYVSGADAIVAIDGSGEPGNDYAAMIAAPGLVSAVATTPDGRHVVSVAGATLVVTPTATHAALAIASMSLSSDAIDLQISPDGRTAAAIHRDPPGVTLIDLASVLAGDAVAPLFVETSLPGAIALSDDTAWLIEDPPNFFCGGESSVRAIDLTSGAVDAVIELGLPASDIVYEPGSETLYIASSCTSSVLAMRNGALVASPLSDVPGASALGVARGQLWAMGHLDGDDAHLILASAPLDGSGDARVLSFPALEDRALATALSETGQDALIRMTPDLASAVDLTVMPDGEHVGILVAAISITTPTGDAGMGQFIIPEVRMITFEYQLAQLDTGLAAQRLRLSCVIEWEPGALLDDFACGLAPGQDELPMDFNPTGVTALFGSR